MSQRQSLGHLQKNQSLRETSYGTFHLIGVIRTEFVEFWMFSSLPFRKSTSVNSWELG